MQPRPETAQEFLAIQKATEELLREVAASGRDADEHSIVRLHKLATAGAKLAYSQGCLQLESDVMHNLVAWCDHLIEPEWKAQFIQALRTSPLASPWRQHG